MSPSWNKTFTSVYRLQLTEQFPLKKAIDLIPYLKELGIEGIYFSPYFTAYSPHGYDVSDANKLNPKLGTMADFEKLCSTMQENNLAHIMDIVPNHMGIRGGMNEWWQDLLRNGSNSAYASFFDVNWEPEKKELKDKILLPILALPYGRVIFDKEIQLHKGALGFYFLYGDSPLPLCPESYPADDEIDAINSDPFKLHDLLEKQHYRIAFWRVASHEINYRRFFNVHDLAALRIEDKEVLEQHHKWIFSLMEEGKVDALRIDHPDGLYDPIAYYKELKKKRELPLIVEKILDREEKLSDSWGIEGSVGYEYLNFLNGLFVYQNNGDKVTSIYEKFVGRNIDFEEILYKSKKLYTNYYMVSEVEMLALLLDRISETDLHFRDFTRFDLTEALQEIIASFPVYRTYIRMEGNPSERDSIYITQAVQKAKERASHLDPSIFAFFEDLLLCKLHQSVDRDYYAFILRFQQLTGPIMAKGLEDTSFYLYNRLISLNEVGADPSQFGYSLREFHEHMEEKQRRWPLGFLPTSTHDTKRSEDVRMRISVISELPEEWEKLIERVEKPPAIDANTTYFIYQMLLGVWPKGEIEEKAFITRIWPLILKSLREAERHTNWIQPNLEYEKRVESFFSTFVSSAKKEPAWQSFLKKVDRLGSLNSLSAQVVRLGLPGVIDIYQGNEAFRYALVDPDNRSEVDYSLLATKLRRAKEADLVELYQNEEYDLLKCALVQRLLTFRRERKNFFLEASYKHLDFGDLYIAYMRKLGDEVVIVVARRFYTKEHSLKEIALPQEMQLTDLFTEDRNKLPFSVFYGTC